MDRAIGMPALRPCARAGRPESDAPIQGTADGPVSSRDLACHPAETRVGYVHCKNDNTNSRRDAMSKRLSVYVVYPAAMFDGWEVVDDRDDDSALYFHTREGAIVYAKARAAMDGGAIVKLENWVGDTEQVWEGAPPKAGPRRAPRSPVEGPAPGSAERAPDPALGGRLPAPPSTPASARQPVRRRRVAAGAPGAERTPFLASRESASPRRPACGANRRPRIR